MAETPERLCLTVAEVSKLLGISRGLAYEAVRAGKIPSVRFGKRLLIPRAALERKLTEASKQGVPNVKGV